MLFTFLVGVAAGAATPLLRPHVLRILQSNLSADRMPDEGRVHALSLAVALMIGAIVLSLLDVRGGALALVLGAALGLFVNEIGEAFQGWRNNRDR